MDILFVADVSISKVIGGAERVLYEQATRLVSRGHNVTILTRKLPNQDKNYEVIQGVDEYRYNCSQKSPVPFLCSTWLNSKRIFESLQEKKKFDCINFHQPLSALGVIHSTWGSRIPKIYTCHSLSFEEFLSRNDSPRFFFPRVKNLIISKGYKKVEKECFEKIESNFSTKPIY